MSIGITWLGQGGYIIELGNRTLAIDPHLSDSLIKKNKWTRLMPIAIEPKDLKVDLILVTHDHIDHLDEETLRYTDWNRSYYAGPNKCLEHLKRIGIPENRLLNLGVDETIQFGDSSIYGVYAHHVYAGQMVESIGVVIKHEGITIYIVGDSLFDAKLFEVKDLSPDILICCINGRLGNMNFKEAAALAKELKVKVAIPSHYGMFAENTEEPLKLKAELDVSIRYLELQFNRSYHINSTDLNFLEGS